MMAWNSQWMSKGTRINNLMKTDWLTDYFKYFSWWILGAQIMKIPSTELCWLIIISMLDLIRTRFRLIINYLKCRTEGINIINSWSKVLKLYPDLEYMKIVNTCRIVLSIRTNFGILFIQNSFFTKCWNSSLNIEFNLPTINTLTSQIEHVLAFSIPPPHSI